MAHVRFWPCMRYSAPVKASLVRWVATLTSVASAAAAIWHQGLSIGALPLPPWPLVWVFWLLVGLGGALTWPTADAAGRALLVVFGVGALVYLGMVGWPSLSAELRLAEWRWLLVTRLGGTVLGLPLPALGAMLVVTAWAGWTLTAPSHPHVGRATAALVLLFGASSVLCYATGSPWPFGR